MRRDEIRCELRGDERRGVEMRRDEIRNNNRQDETRTHSSYLLFSFPCAVLSCSVLFHTNLFYSVFCSVLLPSPS
jgi:hypothetical protein